MSEKKKAASEGRARRHERALRVRAGAKEEDPATSTTMPSIGGEVMELYKENAKHTAKIRASIKGEDSTRKAASQYEPAIARHKLGGI